MIGILGLTVRVLLLLSGLLATALLLTGLLARILVLLAGLVRAGDPRVLSRVADGVVALLALVLVLYLVAPTAQQIVELLANLKLRLGAGGRP